ncbi:MAG: enoyl-CoA hydratase/isomerase family protein [Saprospiraceae bacterium]|nr:enoyl-CoA hydratase/isomerase family protein [Saprospiraceae bacterium]
MTYENLLVAEENGIIIVTVNRPQALNALNAGTFSDLKQLFGTDIAGRKDIKGVIITGAGEKAFIAGADISEFLKLDVASAAQLSKRGHDIFLLIERFHKPVVAAVNGFALGGGCELAMACHLRIAGEKAKFGQPEVNLGIIPGYGGSQRLIQYIGKTKAMELLLTADMIGAEDALRLGLVNHVVPAGQEVAKATEIIEKIATKGPVAIQKTIAAVNAFFELGGQAGFDFEVTAFGDTAGTEDFKEGASAFLEKRKPEFKGN